MGALTGQLAGLRQGLEQRPFVVLDGGLATTLEAKGHDLRDALWSARLLRDDPDAILQVHRDFLEAGADCLVTASYQATLPRFEQAGLSRRQARELLRLSSSLAGQACRQFSRGLETRGLVAASVGPYGALLADGSEYSGDYDGASSCELLRCFSSS